MPVWFTLVQRWLCPGADSGWKGAVRQWALVAAGYVLAVMLVLPCLHAREDLSVFWPSTGVVLAAFWLKGWKVWPGVVCGAMISMGGVLWWWGEPWWAALISALVVALGDLGEGVCCCWLLRRWIGGAPLFTVSGHVGSFMAAVLVSGAVGASLGVLSLHLGGVAFEGTTGVLWASWLVGDAMGMVVACPLLLSWVGNTRALGKGCWWYVLLGPLTWGLCAFNRGDGALAGPEMLVVPVLLWLTFRHGLRGATLATAIICTVETWQHWLRGPSAQEILMLQMFLGILPLSSLLVATLLVERQRVQEELRRAYAGLEERVAERTAEILRARDEIAEYHERFKQAFHANPTPMVISRVADGVLLEVNDSLLELSGLTREELVGHTSVELGFFDRVDGESIMDQIRQQGWVRDYELHPLTRDGRQLSGLLSGDLLELGGEPCFLCIFVNLTERRQMERELMKMQKLEAFARLSGGIAHDFNNLLAGILGNVELAGIQVRKQPDLRGILDRARQECLRAQDLVRQFLSITQVGNSRPAQGQLGDILGETAMNVMEGKLCRLDMRMEEKLFSVTYDEGQIRQMLANLLENACEIMPEGGRVIMDVQNWQLVSGGGAVRPGRYVRISVQDEGPGISEDHLRHIFDPYFSTKPQGAQKGMGLGLTIAYSIMKRHGGYLFAESEVGQGACFRAYLPAETGAGTD